MIAGWRSHTAGGGVDVTGDAMGDEATTETRQAWSEMLQMLADAGTRFAGPDFGLESPGDVAEAHRALLHLLEVGLLTTLEEDANHPVFRPLVLSSLKAMGDNPDAVYFDAPVSSENEYRVTGRTGGAVYMAITVEAGAEDGAMPTGTAGVINDEQIDIAADGSFELFVGGTARDRNWLALPEDAGRLTTRHYFEQVDSAAVPPAPELGLHIEVMGEVSPAPAPDDASVARAVRRVTRFVSDRSIGLGRPDDRPPVEFVSREPHVFPAPVTPGDFALSAADAAYSMAPYLLGPDEALVITGRWPECRFANVVLWNRQMQTFDYASRQISLNRAQTTLEDDGSFRMVIAHQDPLVPNWLDTEGRPFGLVFWRFFLPAGPIETPVAEVVDLADLRP
jgi:hypothetical protein